MHPVTDWVVCLGWLTSDSKPRTEVDLTSPDLQMRKLRSGTWSDSPPIQHAVNGKATSQQEVWLQSSASSPHGNLSMCSSHCSTYFLSQLFRNQMRLIFTWLKTYTLGKDTVGRKQVEGSKDRICEMLEFWKRIDSFLGLTCAGKADLTSLLISL